MNITAPVYGIKYNVKPRRRLNNKASGTPNTRVRVHVRIYDIISTIRRPTLKLYAVTIKTTTGRIPFS